jgi:Protein of unknown function (DUF3182)
VAEHQCATVQAIAREVAALTHRDFEGEYDPSARYGDRPYFVPSETLLAEEASSLGIRSHDDLFGGVVPFPFVATKAIVHPLVAPDADRPPGWSPEFAERIRQTVLPGYTAFNMRDARRAAEELLALGPIRLKPARGVGGRGQTVVPDASTLDCSLGALELAELDAHGVVVELNLAPAETYSIGQVQVDGIQASYCGTQCTTTDNAGTEAFGGSDLVVVRGDFDALVGLPLGVDVRLAITQVRAFDAATDAFAGLIASRRNYDAVRGRDQGGHWRSGVLEQSWRLGGASGPEVAALAAFRADADLRVVRARCFERYGDGHVPPPGATVHYSGVDATVGRLTKYTIVTPYESAA